jgi:hypothetical protein
MTAMADHSLVASRIRLNCIPISFNYSVI